MISSLPSSSLSLAHLGFSFSQHLPPLHSRLLPQHSLSHHHSRLRHHRYSLAWPLLRRPRACVLVHHSILPLDVKGEPVSLLLESPSRLGTDTICSSTSQQLQRLDLGAKSPVRIDLDSTQLDASTADHLPSSSSTPSSRRQSEVSPRFGPSGLPPTSRISTSLLSIAPKDRSTTDSRVNSSFERS